MDGGTEAKIDEHFTKPTPKEIIEKAQAELCRIWEDLKEGDKIAEKWFTIGEALRQAADLEVENALQGAALEEAKQQAKERFDTTMDVALERDRLKAENEKMKAALEEAKIFLSVAARTVPAQVTVSETNKETGEKLKIRRLAEALEQCIDNCKAALEHPDTGEKK